eukprot:COSAG06_NODE_41389_length_392_cov_0.658703_1_plen_46_part_10
MSDMHLPAPATAAAGWGAAEEAGGGAAELSDELLVRVHLGVLTVVP